MKVTLSCPTCRTDPNKSEDCTKLYTVLVSNNGSYFLECDRGHKAAFAGSDIRYELLFEIAMNALVDGYHREAVTSAAASLERFHEFFAHLIFRIRELPDSLFSSMWKEIGSRSEAQTGLFMGSYALLVGEFPPMLKQGEKDDPSTVAFRNDVVHKGRIPSSGEARTFVHHVYSIMLPVMEEFLRKHLKEYGTLHTELRAEIEKTTEGRSVGADMTLSFYRIFGNYQYEQDREAGNFLDESLKLSSFEERLDQIRSTRQPRA